MTLATCPKATLWLLLLLSMLYGQEGPAPEKCVFAGTVQDSVTGQTISKATVQVFSRNGIQPSYLTNTDGQGAFRFEAIAPGDYTIQVSARGYRDVQAVALRPGQFASAFHLTTGQSITGAVAALDPPAIVSGRVSDSDGKPLAGAYVMAMTHFWQADGLQPASVTQADEHGEYRLRVDPGRYVLSAGFREDKVPWLFTEGPGKPEMMVASVFYPNLPDSDGAAELTLRPGEQQGGMDFKLPTVATYHVRGKVGLPVDSAGNRFVTLERRSGGTQDRGSSPLKRGAFDIAGVTPGIYWLRLISPMGDRIGGKMPIEVTDRDVNGVAFEAMPPLTVKGRARFDDGEPHDLSHVELVLSAIGRFNFGGNFRRTTPKPDGSFQFDNVTAAELTLQTTDAGDVYLDSVSYNHTDAPAGRMDLSAGVAGDIEVVLGLGRGEIGGIVHFAEVLPGAPPPAAAQNMAAVLIPADLTRRPGMTLGVNTGVRWAQIDQDGRFHFPRLPPGRYYLWADKGLDDRWHSAQYVAEMQSRAVMVDLPKKGSVQVEISEVVE